MKSIAIQIREQKPDSSALRSSSISDEKPKISIDQIQTLVTPKQYKVIEKKLREISKIINSD
ncbi:MAG: hypothetical protein LC112_07615 [Flavobacteriales bacterium]|nr:hypothetical protein [Flavobacteriales bacterium]